MEQPPDKLKPTGAWTFQDIEALRRVVGDLDLIRGPCERGIDRRQVALIVERKAGRLTQRISACQQLPAGVPGLGTCLAGSVSRGQRSVLGVPGKGSNSIVAAAILLAEVRRSCRQPDVGDRYRGDEWCSICF
jgi:hypothetical protein